MKRIFYFIMSLFILAVAISCKDSKPKSVMSQTGEVEDSASTNDSTIYGTMVDGGMNSIILLTDNGDTLEYLVNPDDTLEVVKGGKINGDRFAIIGYKEYGDNFMRSAINLTSLLGNWSSLDRNFEIKEGGTVTSSLQSEKNPWTAWKIWNGKLILSKDTFDIENLGADTLSLENKAGIFVFTRGK
jgi:lipoprotein